MVSTSTHSLHCFGGGGGDGLADGGGGEGLADGGGGLGGGRQTSLSPRHTLQLAPQYVDAFFSASTESGTVAPAAAKRTPMGASHAFGTITRTLHDTSVTSVPSNATQSFPATLPPCPTMPLASAPTHGQGPLSATPSQAGFGGAGPSSRTIVK